jgi:hypothetical protein
MISWYWRRNIIWWILPMIRISILFLTIFIFLFIICVLVPLISFFELMVINRHIIMIWIIRSWMNRSFISFIRNFSILIWVFIIYILWRDIWIDIWKRGRMWIRVIWKRVFGLIFSFKFIIFYKLILLDCFLID